MCWGMGGGGAALSLPSAQRTSYPCMQRRKRLAAAGTQGGGYPQQQQMYPQQYPPPGGYQAGGYAPQYPPAPPYNYPYPAGEECDCSVVLLKMTPLHLPVIGSLLPPAHTALPSAAPLPL